VLTIDKLEIVDRETVYAVSLPGTKGLPKALIECDSREDAEVHISMFGGTLVRIEHFWTKPRKVKKRGKRSGA
jgi:hypothetical protein